MAGCPHERIEYCPLYVAAHGINNLDGSPLVFGLGCVSDLTEPCDVKRDRMNYAEAVEKVRAVAPRPVAIIAFREAEFFRREQRARNMRAAGVQ